MAMMRIHLLLLVLVATSQQQCGALDNGIFLKPPMGWLAWGRYRCEIDCDLYPKQCISESLFTEMADRMAEDGWKEAGYEFVNVDDCWSDKKGRAENGELQADPERFPGGMKALGDYIHSKGLRFGLYTDIGDKTCGGYPGTGGHFDVDAKSFADWGVDSIKVDGCYANTSEFSTLYPELGRALNRTGRSIGYVCSWPAYMQGHSDFQQISQYCNQWRNYNDIEDSWDSVKSIIQWWKKMQNDLVSAARPGAWNDPDMIMVGNYGLSLSQSEAQLAIWSIVAAPLLLTHDLRDTNPEVRRLLLNKDMIAVDQDAAGKEGGFRKTLNDGVELWTRSLEDGGLAAALLRLGDSPGPFPVKVKLSLTDVGLDGSKAWSVKDIFKERAVDMKDKAVEALVEPTGVTFLRFYPVGSADIESLSDAVNQGLYTDSDTAVIKANLLPSEINKEEDGGKGSSSVSSSADRILSGKHTSVWSPFHFFESYFTTQKEESPELAGNVLAESLFPSFIGGKNNKESPPPTAQEVSLLRRRQQRPVAKLNILSAPSSAAVKEEQYASMHSKVDATLESSGVEDGPEPATEADLVDLKERTFFFVKYWMENVGVEPSVPYH